jgi:hypothetical protein
MWVTLTCPQDACPPDESLNPIADRQWGFFMVLWVLMLSRINKTNFKYSKKR